MTDEDKYRTAKVNIHLYRIYKGDTLVGQVRMGLDNKWYPELPAEVGKMRALHRLILANEALQEFSVGQE